MTFFLVKNYADEYLKALDKDFKGNIMEPDTDETVAQTADEIIETTRDFILKELSKNLKGYDLEPFVANLLQAMGYRTILSPHGGESGKWYFLTLEGELKNGWVEQNGKKYYLANSQLMTGWRHQRDDHPVSERRYARRRLWPVRDTIQLYQKCAEIPG